MMEAYVAEQGEVYTFCDMPVWSSGRTSVASVSARSSMGTERPRSDAENILLDTDSILKGRENADLFGVQCCTVT